MQIISTVPLPQNYSYPVVALGNFDGVHVGHKAIINTVITQAKIHNGTSIVCMYEPNTKVFFQKIDEKEILTPTDEKVQLLEKLGVDICIVFPFTNEFAQQTAEDFVKEILVDKIGIKEFIIGYDTNFGSDQKGDKTHLDILGAKYDFVVTMVEPLEIDGKIVSSTGMRKKYILEE